MKIHHENKNACREILEQIQEAGLLDEFEQRDIEEVLQWFGEPDEYFPFFFTLTISRSGESINFDIEHDCFELRIVQYHHSNEGRGSDSFTSYRYVLGWEGVVYEEGEISSWLSGAKEALRFAHNDEDVEVEVHLSLDEG